MSFILDHWNIVISLAALLVLIGIAVFAFIKLPSAKQLEKVKAWLLLAVTQAEAELGAGTGKLKLRLVYDLFITKFTWIARIISFETFTLLVDQALEEMREMLATNEAVAQLVYTSTIKNQGDNG